MLGGSDRQQTSAAYAVVICVAVAVGCNNYLGTSTADPRDADVRLLSLGKVEWLDPASTRVQIPDGLDLIRKVRVVNETASTLGDVRLHSSCTRCATAQFSKALADESLSQGECVEVVVSFRQGGIPDDGRMVTVLLSAQLPDASQVHYPMTMLLTPKDDPAGNIAMTLDEPVAVECDWKSAQKLELNAQVRLGKSIDHRSLSVSTSSPALSATLGPFDAEEGHLMVCACLSRAATGAVEELIRLSGHLDGNGDEVRLMIPVRGWIAPRYKVSPRYVHVGAVDLRRDGMARVVVEIRSDASDDSRPEVIADGAWEIDSVASGGSNVTSVVALLRRASAERGDISGRLVVGGDMGDEPVEVLIEGELITAE